MTRRGGFTLLEILVAIAILAIIVIIVSQIFGQSRAAWESGHRKTGANMEARACITLMAEELSRAVADSVLTTEPPAGFGRKLNMAHNSTILGFWTVGGGERNQRQVQYILYQLVGGKIRRQCIRPYADLAHVYPTLNAGAPDAAFVDMIDDVEDLRFYMSDGVSHTTNLPAWVGIEIRMRKGSSYSAIRVSSDGPDGISGNADDIKSWVD